MSPGDRDALNALERRLRHAQSIAELLADCPAVDDSAVRHAFGGIADTISGVVDQLIVVTAKAAAT